jgi:hypothetical protein
VFFSNCKVSDARNRAVRLRCCQLFDGIIEYVSRAQENSKSPDDYMPCIDERYMNRITVCDMIQFLYIICVLVGGVFETTA